MLGISLMISNYYLESSNTVLSKIEKEPFKQTLTYTSSDMFI